MCEGRSREEDEDQKDTDEIFSGSVKEKLKKHHGVSTSTFSVLLSSFSALANKCGQSRAQSRPANRSGLH